MEASAYTVEELTEAIAGEVVLYIAVIGVIENVENSESDPCMLFFYGQADLAPDLQIRRNKSRKPQLISGSYKFAALIDG